MTRSRSAAPHWAGLDGLRGIAAMAVVVFHADVLGVAANGYAGVDVFFALSGFLITSLLVGGARTHRPCVPSLPCFCMRRVLRLYPALVAACAGVLALALVGSRLDAVLPAVLAALLYVANWWVYSGGEAPMLEHTWTLAIEEHFYLVWPVLLIAALSPRRGIRASGWMTGALLLVVLLVPWPETIDGVRHSYLRGAPIIRGSVLALLLPRRRSSAGAWLGRRLVPRSLLFW